MCTDVPCTWNKPRRITLPSEITCIDTRINQPCPTPLVPTLENYDPPSFISRTIQKDFYNLCKGTNALVLQTLYSNDFDNDDSEGGQTVTETIEDVFKANVFICDLNFVMKS